MKLDRARQSAEAQQAQQAAHPQDAHRHRQGHAGGYSGGMHKGVAYRHAPRAQLPAKRNTGPAPRARPRPASSAAAGAHHDEEHPRNLADDPWSQGGGAGMGLMGGLGGVSGQGSNPGKDTAMNGRGHTGGRSTTDTPAPPPPLRQPPVQEGAALRRSRTPEAELLRSTPHPDRPVPAATLLNAFASLYFQAGIQAGIQGQSPSGIGGIGGGGRGGATGTATSLSAHTGSGIGSAAGPEAGLAAASAAALRLAARAALMRHLPPAAAAPTMAEIRASAVAWCQAQGRPPSSTEAQQNANLLFPLHAFRAMTRLDGGNGDATGSATGTGAGMAATTGANVNGSASARAPSVAINALLQRALETHPIRKTHEDTSS